jgi:peptidoglycan/xylan/chitin deacetylase (PgdA/CDA1 family)
MAQGMHWLKLSRAALAWQRARHGGAYIRVINYHATPARDADSFRRQLEFYRQHFVAVGRDELDALLLGGEWPHEKPGLLISFDDGLRSNYEVAAPLLEEYGFPGWFFVPTGFVSLPGAVQAAFAQARRISVGSEPGADGRVAMSWDELRRLDARHVVGCHGRTHRRLGSELSPAELESEIVASKREIERELGHDMPYFCWIGGEESGYSAAAAAAIRDAGYRYGFMTNCERVVAGTPPLQIQRTNVEAGWPLPVVAFQLSGALDLLYAAKRRRVNVLTAVPAA